MTYMTAEWLPKRNPHDIIEAEDKPHEVITMRAGHKFRVFCNWLWCPYNDVLTSKEEAERAVTEHESLNTE